MEIDAVMNEALLSLNSACRVLGMSRPTLVKLANTRKVAHIKVGNRYKFTMKSLNEYIEREMVKAEEERND